VVISGGGTGGHVYPLLAVAEALSMPLEQPDAQGQPGLPAKQVELLYIGSVGGMEESIVARTDLEYQAVDSAPIRGIMPWQLWGNVNQLWCGYRQACRLLTEWAADVALVSGAYVSVPVALAARRCRIPAMIYLPDREPGLAVRLLSWFVDRIAVSFEQIRDAFPAPNRHKVWVSGYPVRVALLEAGAQTADRSAQYSVLGLDPALKTLLVLGGSRGARPINQALVAALPELLECCQIVHVTGQLDWQWISTERDRLLAEAPAGEAARKAARYHAYAYLHEELAAAMAVADLVVARAGAATLAEFPAVGLPSILVPYPYSGQHQSANADFMVAHGASVRVDNADLDTQLKPTVLCLLGNEQDLERMRDQARALARPDAAGQLAAELRRLALNRPGYTV
jgi:UDP-N-acetylglucosamine--N-acetylmuramyl-(pentapeptide) pyrophosphoryl-undecaprenol N-acetylglucosamine transferase